VALRALFIHNKLEIYTFEIIHSQLLISFPHLINLNQYRTQQVHAISARGLKLSGFQSRFSLVWSYLYQVYVALKWQ